VGAGRKKIGSLAMAIERQIAAKGRPVVVEIQNEANFL
jgi:hypothetical protein